LQDKHLKAQVDNVAKSLRQEIHAS